MRVSVWNHGTDAGRLRFSGWPPPTATKTMMKTQYLSLSGVAAIALICTTQAFAQTAPDQTPPPGTSSQDNGLYGSEVNPPQYSSPAEKQKTQELNSQAVGGTAQSPAT